MSNDKPGKINSPDELCEKRFIRNFKRYWFKKPVELEPTYLQHDKYISEDKWGYSVIKCRACLKEVTVFHMNKF